MSTSTDVYSTIANPSSEVLFKDRKSKFYGRAFPLRSESEVKPIVESLKKQYPSAGHFCYAWKTGLEHQKYRANDDGEPKNSAGIPIYGQIQSCGLTNILIVVLRIYGGTKLGVSGLINAYKTTAKMVLDASTIVERTNEIELELLFGYPLMNEVMRILKKLDLRMVSKKMEMECSMIIAVPKSKTNGMHQELKRIHGLKIKQLNPI